MYPFFVVFFLVQEGLVVLVADCCNHRLALWRLRDGTVWMHLGGEGGEPGQFSQPQAVAVTRSRALVVTDTQRLQVLALDGSVLCVLRLDLQTIGLGRLGLCLWALSSCGIQPVWRGRRGLGYNLFGLIVCADSNDIIVTDWNNHRVLTLMWSPGWLRSTTLFFFVFLCFFLVFF